MKETISHIPPRRDVAVIGMAGRFPGARNLDLFWNLLENGEDVVAEVNRWPMEQIFSPLPPKPCKTYCKWGAFLGDIDRFDPLFFHISPKQAGMMDPRQRLFLEVAWEALEYAGYAGDRIHGTRTGVFAGVTNNQYLFLSDRLIKEQQNGLDNSNSGIANHLSYFLNISGPSIAIDTTCSSSLMAVHAACQSICLGESDMALAGGVNLILLPDYFVTMSQMKLLSPEPKHRVLDRGANGFIPGEGAGVVLLKPLQQAIADNDTIHAVIRGSSANYSGRTSHITAPGLKAEKEVVESAVLQAGIDLRTVSYLELNGAGTVLGDFVELKALSEIFNTMITSEEPPCLVGSVKTNIGNLEAASGIAGLIKVLLSMRHKKIPATLHFEKGNRFLKWQEIPFKVCTAAHQWLHGSHPMRAGVSSFGVGGANVHIQLESYADEVRIEEKGVVPGARKDLDRASILPFIFTISANRYQSLSDLTIRIKEAITSEVDLRDLSHTLTTGRAHLRYRLVVIATGKEKLIERLDAFQNHRENETGNIGSGLYYSGRLDTLSLNIATEYNIHPLASIMQMQKGGVEDPAGCVIIQTETPPYDHKDCEKYLVSLAESYIKGCSLDWSGLYSKCRCKKLILPTYPFERRRCWFDSKTGSSPVANEEHISVSFLSKQELASRIQRFFVKQFVHKLGYQQEDIEYDLPFSDYGIDSIIMFELIELLEQDTGLYTDKAQLFDLTSITDVVRFYQDLPEPRGERVEKRKTVVARVASMEKPAVATSDVAIIGMSGRFPKANSIEEFWDNLENGVDSVTEIPANRFDIAHYYDPDERRPGKMSTRWGSFIDNFDCFDASFFSLHKTATERTDPQQRLFLEQVWTALEFAGYTKQDLVSSKTGVFAGLSSEDYGRLIHNSDLPLTHYDGLGSARSILANRISHFFGLNGPSMVIDTACSSSLSAVHLACQSLRGGECDMAIAGGVNLAFDPSPFIIFSKAGVLSKSGRCRVFDQTADGYVRGEGVCVIILKELQRAIEDGDTVQAVIKGSAINHNGENFSITSPSLKSQVELLESVYHETGISPETITYIEAGSTGTHHGDPVEIRALDTVFGRYTKKKSYCALGSIKTHVGHLEAVSGMAGLIGIIGAMRRGKIPALLHFSQLNQAIDLTDSPFFINDGVCDWQPEGSPKRAAITNYGFGGTNVHLVLEQAQDTPSKPVPDAGIPYICTLSAKTPQALKQLVQDLKSWLQSDPEAGIRDICYTLNRGRNHFTAHRLSAPIKSRQELRAFLESVEISEKRIKTKGLIFAFGEANEFPAHFSFLYGAAPFFRETVKGCDDALETVVGCRFLSRRLDGTEKGEWDAGTPQSRCVAFALQCSVARLLTAWGMKPAQVAGEGLGLFSAACFAGVFSLEDGLRMIARLSGKEPDRLDHAVSGETGKYSGNFKDHIAFGQPDIPLYYHEDEEGLLAHELEGRGLASFKGMDCPGHLILEMGYCNQLASHDSAYLPGLSWSLAMPSFLSFLYQAGVNIDWAAVWHGENGRRIPLPTYPFQRKRFWPISTSHGTPE